MWLQVLTRHAKPDEHEFEKGKVVELEPDKPYTVGKLSVLRRPHPHDAQVSRAHLQCLWSGTDDVTAKPLRKPFLVERASGVVDFVELGQSIVLKPGDGIVLATYQGAASIMVVVMATAPPSQAQLQPHSSSKAHFMPPGSLLRQAAAMQATSPPQVVASPSPPAPPAPTPPSTPGNALDPIPSSSSTPRAATAVERQLSPQHERPASAPAATRQRASPTWRGGASRKRQARFPARAHGAASSSRAKPPGPPPVHWHHDPALAPLDAPVPAQPQQVSQQDSVEPPLEIKVCSDPQVNWGHGGSWCEPYNEEAAMETLDKLRQHWLCLGGRRRPRARAAARNSGHARHAAGTSHSDSEEEQDHEDGDVFVNTVCDHIACQECPFCIISQMEIVRDSYYHRGSTDQYKEKAAMNAILALRTADIPVRTRDDLEAVGVKGLKTLDKLDHIIGTGQLTRNKEQANNSEFQAIKQLASVWGVGVLCARKWYNMGATSVDIARRLVFHELGHSDRASYHSSDADSGSDDGYDTEEEKRRGAAKRTRVTAAASPPKVALPELKEPIRFSETQKVGLMYHYDFSERIPRAEVARIEAVIRSTLVQVLCDITGLRPDVVDAASAALHCRALGSFVRGAATSADVDMMISAPALCESEQAVLAAGGKARLESPAQLLSALLAALLKQRAITHDCSPDTCKDRTTFLGVWAKGGPAQAALYRRLDIKVYQRAHLATAMIHFGSGERFNRALRYWANTLSSCDQSDADVDAPNRYWAKCPPKGLNITRRPAVGWHLSDTDLSPFKWGTERGQTVSAGECARTVCETDVFTLLKLDYVPLHMRGLL